MIELTPHLHKLVTGQLGHNAATIARYRESLEAQGFELPPLPEKERRQHARLIREKVGTALANRIEWMLKIKSDRGCKCATLKAEMDAWGISGCEEKKEYIVNRLMSKRDMLAGALRNDSGWPSWAIPPRWLVLGAVELIPDAVLRAGADWLLKKAIEDVKASTGNTPARITGKAPKPHRHTGNRKSIPPICRQPMAQITPRPFTAKPRLTLLFHCWPNGDSWKRHVDYLQPVSDVFNRKIMGVATGPGASTLDEVQAAFGDSWEYFEVANDKALREVLTYRTMLKMVQSTDENDVTFCAHSKGAQKHTAASEQIRWWTEAMYETVVHNYRNVLTTMEQGYPIAGSFLRVGKLLQARYGWHFSGTFYAFRNAIAFENGVPGFASNFYGTESWPGHHFARHEAACLFADDCGDIYKENQQLEQEMNQWRRRNET